MQMAILYKYLGEGEGTIDGNLFGKLNNVPGFKFPLNCGSDVLPITNFVCIRFEPFQRYNNVVIITSFYSAQKPQTKFAQ